MDNIEYEKILNTRLNGVSLVRKELIGISKKIIGDSLYMEDLFFTSAIDRSVALLDGLASMLQLRNLTCAGIILRSQLDNCMRVFAAFIAEDRKKFIEDFMDGKKISQMKDNQGNKMTDVNLRKRLSQYDNQLDTVYQNSSGYVHLSNKAFFMSTTIPEDKENTFEFKVGLPIKEKANPILLEFLDAFMHYVKLQNVFLNKVAISKQNMQ